MSTISGLTGFASRHIGPDASQIAQMLAVLGMSSLDELIEAALPDSIRSHRPLNVPGPLSEQDAAEQLAQIAAGNRVAVSMIGLGYYDTLLPAVIERNVLSDPGWYTAYTPYQPEIAQGRLEALLNFQTMVADLTGLPVANASLLDEPTAAAEAMTLLRRAGRSRSRRFVVDRDTHPQTLAVLATRAEPLGIDLDVRDIWAAGLGEGDCFGVLLGYPGSSGRLGDPRAIISAAHAGGALVALTCDLLACTLLVAPGELGADVAVGSAQRFGVPLGFGGPHAGFMAVRAGLERQLPGRLVGVSRDSRGRPAYRLALQTREQHIRRDRATSNICTAQALLAIIAGLYAAYHGPLGLREIAQRVAGHTQDLARQLAGAGWVADHADFFDTLRIRVPGRAQQVVARAAEQGINLLLATPDVVGISVDEVTTAEHVEAVVAAFQDAVGAGPGTGSTSAHGLPDQLRSNREILSHPSFHRYHSETAMMRYLRTLKDADIALDRAMIPLGSCTMKLNPAAAMAPITDPTWARIHPFAPLDQVRGYTRLIAEVEAALAELTGYDAVSLQPNAGSQGELAGLLAIRAWHRDHQSDAAAPVRDICLIPASAHGTNAASAVMAGLKVVVVACDDDGNVDLAALADTLARDGARVAALMVTYPSTHGVYEPGITRICQMIHEVGGQVYVDGANLNALVGLSRPGEFGADVSHLNLHKTFAIPHGGGGPGVGPVAVRSHLAPYLPGHPLRPEAGPVGRGLPDGGVGPVSGAPWGSAGVIPIPWMYLQMLGPQGLRLATEVAVLSANYVAARLAAHYPVLYTGPGGLVGHECILDLRGITAQTGVTAEDVAKRLIDYGFHAPTMSFPVAGTLMVEPTESEPLAELDRFIEAMVAIRREIAEVAAGGELAGSALRLAPHTAMDVVADWDRTYSRATGVFPAGEPGPGQAKYWPPVNRIDGAYGDRNLSCACPPLSAFE